MPWLGHGYPLRAFDFHEIDALSAEFQSLFLYDKMRRHSPPPSRRSVPFPPPDSPSIAEDNHPFAPLTTNRSSPSVMMNSEQHSESALSISKNPPQVRRLYSAVLQNQMDIAKTDLAKTPSVEELEELEREALEQYRPSEESLTKASNDSISSDKFQVIILIFHFTPRLLKQTTLHIPNSGASCRFLLTIFRCEFDNSYFSSNKLL